MAVSFAMQAPNGQVHVELPNAVPCGCDINNCQAYNSSGQLSSSIGSNSITNQSSLPQVKRDITSVARPSISTSAITVGSVCQGEGVLSLALVDSILRDSQGRIGYLAGDRQFQFDDPPQSGAIVTAGFSVCNNGSLALGRSSTWWACSSGTFSKLYDQDWAGQCTAIQLKTVQVLDCSTDPLIVTAGSLSPSFSSYLAALAKTPVDLPSRIWGLPSGGFDFPSSAATSTLIFANLTSFNLTMITSNPAAATILPNLNPG